MSAKQLTETYGLERGTKWAEQVVNFDPYSEGDLIMPNWEGPKHYVREKQAQALRDMVRLQEYLARFVETGDVLAFYEYRQMLEVMTRESDSGAWFAIAEGAR